MTFYVLNDREPLLRTLNIGLTEVLKKIVIPWKFLVRFEEEKHIFLPNKIFFWLASKNAQNLY